MSKVSPRTRDILIILLESKDYISIQSLALRLNISKRTIQRELENIDNSLKEYNVRFVSKTGVGIKIEGDEYGRDQLLSELKENLEHDASNKEERRKKLLLEILKEKGLHKLYYYSRILDVSEATVGNDLEAIKGWLHDYDLAVVRCPGRGIIIEGTEGNYRRAIRAFIEENIGSDLIRNFYEQDFFDTKSLLMLKKSNICQLLDENILKQVIECLQHVNNIRIATLTENAYLGLVIHISIVISRILQSDTMKNGLLPLVIEKDEDYYLAKHIVEELEKEFKLSIPEAEISYIYLHLRGSKRQKAIEVDSENMIKLVNEMITAYDPNEAYHLRQDNQFIQGLLAHIQPTFIRLTHHMKINNPILEDIKKEYPVIFRKCIAVGKVVEDWIGCQVPEEEVGFLAIHFGAATLRLNSNQEPHKVSVGIICAGGIGLSQLMLSKLEKTFRNRVELTAYGSRDITEEVIANTDFFINSITMDNVDAHMVLVSPLLSDADITRINEVLQYYERKPRKQKQQPSITNQLELVNQLAVGIKTVLQDFDLSLVRANITFEDIVVSIAEQVTKEKSKQSILIQDIFEREKLITQIFAELGFALIHARTKGVTEPTLQILRPFDHRFFTDDYMKQVSVAIVMLVPDDEKGAEYSQMFGYLCSLLIEEPVLLDTIINKSKEEIYEIISLYLRQYFSNYIERFK